jgi:hypothetical protein
VARHNEGDRVAAVGSSNCSYRPRPAYRSGDLLIGRCLSKGDCQQVLPDSLLERSASHGEWQVKVASHTGEIVTHLFEGLDSQWVEVILVLALLYKVE